jgi:hypothetical protein
MFLNIQKRENIFIYALQLMTIGIYFGLFTRLTNIPTFWPSIVMVLLITISSNLVVIGRRSVLKILLLLLVIIFYDYLDHLRGLPEVQMYPFGLFTIVYPYLLVAIIIENLLIFKSSFNKMLFLIGRFGLWILILALAISVINEIIFSGIMRKNGMQYNMPFWAWTVSFGTLYSMPFVLMTVVMFYKGKSYIIYSIIFLIIFSIIRAGFVIALIITGVGLIFALLYRYKIKNIILNISVILSMIIIGISNLNNIISLLPKLPNQIYSEKASDISKIQKQEGLMNIIYTTRQGVYDASVNTIIKNPIFGSGDYADSGQHSYILDKLSFLGIFGTIFYFIVLFTLFKRSSLLIEKSERNAYGYIIITVFLLLLFNPIEWPDFWLSVFVIVPAIIVYLNEVEDKKYKTERN